MNPIGTTHIHSWWTLAYALQECGRTQEANSLTWYINHISDTEHRAIGELIDQLKLEVI